MGENYCYAFETFNPEVEYQKFLKRKPILLTRKLYEGLQKRDEIKCPENFKPYGIGSEQNDMYRTHNSEYGYYAPNAFTVPTRYYPLSQRFSSECARFGMYRNYSLNTNMDHSFY